MKVILSRKGFDSMSGGVPSPILEDETLLSLPIPDSVGTYRFEDLSPRGMPLARIVHDLTGGKYGPGDRVHLDPDIERTATDREPGWIPAFGQSGPAAGHLIRQGVGPGDLFLFFGWFHSVAVRAGQYQYVPKAQDLHVLFGWLRIGNVIQPDTESCPTGLSRHPHFGDGKDRKNNRVYIGEEAGTFRTFSAARQLTAPGRRRSYWRLPAWFQPGTRTPLTYHRNAERWHLVGEHVELDTVGRGQEFVVDSLDYPEVEAWARGLIEQQA